MTPVLQFHQSVIYGVNDRGQAVGVNTAPDGQNHATLWQNGTVVDLGSLGGGVSYAYAVNNLGHIVGDSYTTNGVVPFIWSDGVMRALDPTLIDGHAAGINDRDQVVGNSTLDVDLRAFLY